MNWKFWKKDADETGGHGVKLPKPVKPKDLPEAVGRKMVVEMKMEPDLVWSLKYMQRPVDDGKDLYEFRIFNPDKARGAGVVVKDWNSLDEHADLVMFSGRYGRKSGKIEILETA